MIKIVTYVMVISPCPSECSGIVKSVHRWEVARRVALLDGSIGWIIVGRAWAGCYGYI